MVYNFLNTFVLPTKITGTWYPTSLGQKKQFCIILVLCLQLDPLAAEERDPIPHISITQTSMYTRIQRTRVRVTMGARLITPRWSVKVLKAVSAMGSPTQGFIPSRAGRALVTGKFKVQVTAHIPNSPIGTTTRVGNSHHLLERTHKCLFHMQTLRV